MISRTEIIASIGEDTYREACSAAKRVAAQAGTSLGKNDFNSNVPHEISTLVWDSSGDDDEKLHTIFQFYEEMPSYGYLMYISMAFRGFSEKSRSLVWTKYMAYLSGEDDLAGPAAYSLWCDLFEDPAKVHEAWAALTGDIANERLLQHILIASGPVPYDQKEVLYRRILPDGKWHYFIFRSLLHSRFDVYGQIDKEKARHLLQHLDLPSQTENFELLKTALEQPD